MRAWRVYEVGEPRDVLRLETVESPEPGPGVDPGRIRATHAELMRLHETGAIAPLVSELLPLEDAADGLARLATRGTWGKVVCVG